MSDIKKWRKVLLLKLRCMERSINLLIVLSTLLQCRVIINWISVLCILNVSDNSQLRSDIIWQKFANFKN